MQNSSNIKEIVNVVEEYNYDTQSEKYNQEFKRWRKNKQNPYAFNFEMNRKESVYIESKGFKAPNMYDAEAETIGKIASIAGIAMIIWIFVDTLLSKLIIQIFDYIGFDIHSNFFSSSLYGGGKEIVTALIIISFLRTVIPSIYLKKKLRLPDEVRSMHTMNHPSELVRAISLTIVISTVSCLPNVYSNSTSQLYTYFMKLDADVAVWGQTEFLIYTVYDIILLSIFTEALFHGSIFAALRQFGDYFAIAVTSVLSGLIVQDFSEMPFVIVVSAIAGAGMLRSGSIYTAFFVRIVYKIYRLAIVIIETTVEADLYLERNAFMFFTLATSGVALFILHFLQEPREYYAEYKSEVSPSKRAFFLIKSYPLPVVVCICLLSAALKIIF